jgi:hypothetical protein
MDAGMREHKTVKWMPIMFMVATSLCSWGQSQPRQRFALTVSQIAQTLSAGGIQVADQQVSLPAKIVATQPNPALDVLSVKPLDERLAGPHVEGSSLVRMACHQPDACLPFYAIVRWPEGPSGRATDPFSTFSVSGSRGIRPHGAVTMRAGTHAMLVMDDGRSHIEVAVVSLESGMAGQKIRVASPDRKQVYEAEVVSASLLKRSL